MENDPIDQQESASTETDEQLPDEGISRRSFFKRAAVGGAAALAGGGAVVAAGSASVEGRIAPDYPEINEDFKPFRQKNTVLHNAVSPQIFQQEGFSDRIPTFVKANPQLGDDFIPWPIKWWGKHKKDWHNPLKAGFEHNLEYDENRPGFTQVDAALHHASWMPWLPARLPEHLSREMGEELGLEGGRLPYDELPYKGLQVGGVGVPDTAPYNWSQDFKHPTKAKFKSAEEAADAVRTAGRMFGAVRVGIAKNDSRWNYDPLYNMLEDREFGWDEFPFKPKSVIVLLVPMDYDAMATAPSRISAATAGMGYTQMAVVAGAMKYFMNGLGYNAVGSGNDLGINGAYGIMAGLGEGGRNNTLLTPGYGPRVRICKVYTDFDFEDAYDQPRTWGMTEFCKSCKKCAEACPSGAISMEDDTSFHPVFPEGDERAKYYTHKDDLQYTWSNHHGVKKFHTDAKRCVTYWLEVDGDCGACIASCTFNEPDFWHHWFVMAINPIMPKAIHGLMADMHPAFGYGSTEDPEKVKKFWKTGQGMRVNKHNKHTYGTSNIS
jgi:reductive dehalogenase